jgi:S1-C subfamily serine protease
VVGAVDSGSPAKKAGLQELDIITHFKNKEVNSAEELIQAIHDSQIGEDVEITFIRDQTERIITARLVESLPPN